jgi:hypothetical protein
VIDTPRAVRTALGPHIPERRSSQPGNEAACGVVVSEIASILSAIEDSDAGAAGRLRPLVQIENFRR